MYDCRSFFFWEGGAPENVWPWYSRNGERNCPGRRTLDTTKPGDTSSEGCPMIASSYRGHRRMFGGQKATSRGICFHLCPNSLAWSSPTESTRWHSGRPAKGGGGLTPHACLLGLHCGVVPGWWWRVVVAQVWVLVGSGDSREYPVVRLRCGDLRPRH